MKFIKWIIESGKNQNKYQDFGWLCGFAMLQIVGYFALAIYLENIFGSNKDYNKSCFFFLDFLRRGNKLQ
jgi:hypothetical protein